jgi:hypothetical protein
MNNTLDQNFIKTTPDFVYTPAQPFEIAKAEKSPYQQYINKFKTAIYATILFIILSLPTAYKILDMLIKIFTNKIDIIDDECDSPLPLGRGIMALLIGILVFIL